ncbi:putative ATP-binding/permease protein [Streptococcus criceti]|uniref:ABC transporter, permease/ATP-binding protein n=1 Tax=Streptococcus criceti HS-6 TaxID=873449 RepID=G5JPF8_STRCG|nr:ABC transporter ATP-binding protein [Streptococcus criceti]EHI74329.1 ABC transporter, permease/ATP-binding protein [Streptococcus criceti HS-6]SUN37439.1 putative ATP-binding/permease protein [Streptococcus criceti]
MKDLLKYFRGYIKETILGPLFKLLEASFELLVPIIIARIVDKTIPHKDTIHLFMMIGLLVCLAVFGVLVAITAQYYSSKAAVGYTRQLTKDLYKKIMKLPKESRDRLTTSSLVTRLSSDTYQIQTGINQFLRLFLRAPIIVFGSVIMAFLISPKITIWFVLMVGLLFLLIYTMSRLVNPLYLVIRQLTDRLVSRTREQLEGMQVIRAFGQIERVKQEFASLNQSYTKAQLKTGLLSSLVSPLTYLIVNATLVIVIWQGNLAIGDKLLTQGSLIALVNYLLNILAELLKLAMMVTNINQSFISARRITEVFGQEEENLHDSIEQLNTDKGEVLSISDMTFTYPAAARPSLTDLSLSLGQGQTLGVIGGTGSGKSTLVQLIMGLYQAQKGQLTIFNDGQSPANLAQWRNWVGLVPQKAELFLGTIRSNLTLGMETNKVSDEQLWWALDIAQASDFVKEKEGGLDSEVKEFGRNFSGGQRQRLTIARAVLRQAPILILDDSTSALDYLTESKLLKAIKSELKTSLIVISQRTNSLKSADKILVLDKGNQVGLGSHESLLANCPTYQAIHYSQHKEDRA